MNNIREHWQDVGLALAVGGAAALFAGKQDNLSLVLWLSLIALLLHQFEEYRWPGYFPGMFNRIMFNSRQPDRFPLNTNTSLIVNVGAWALYLLAALAGERALWLGIATMTVNVGNFIVHTFVFNIKGRTLYNPGMFTSVFLFLPVSAYFFHRVIQGNLVTQADWMLGIALGIASSAGLIRLINGLKDEETAHVFPKRCIFPDRNKQDK